MSYCRKGDDSDVYMYRDMSGNLVCCACDLDENTVFSNEAEAFIHLIHHRSSGHRVPDRSIQRLLREMGMVII